MSERPTCVSCRWYEVTGRRAQICENPRIAEWTALVVGPDVKVVGTEATVARFHDFMCGIEGLWWEAKG
jgi:hypothetical protein